MPAGKRRCPLHLLNARLAPAKAVPAPTFVGSAISASSRNCQKPEIEIDVDVNKDINIDTGIGISTGIRIGIRISIHVGIGIGIRIGKGIGIYRHRYRFRREFGQAGRRHHFL